MRGMPVDNERAPPNLAARGKSGVYQARLDPQGLAPQNVDSSVNY